MSPRERLQAAIDGRQVGGKLTVGWSSDCDVQIGAPDGLAYIPNLYLKLGPLSGDPASVAERLDEAQQESLRVATDALYQGAAGVFYEIGGANAGQCTPMQYGGLYLERDREFLQAIDGATVAYVSGSEPYLDFVSDLPASAFGWDLLASGIAVDEVRRIRPRALAAEDAEADIVLKGVASRGLDSTNHRTLNHA